ncbi:hypothetical protein GCK32_006871, partial [Trichostrongylus colubriformis]
IIFREMIGVLGEVQLLTSAHLGWSKRWACGPPLLRFVATVTEAAQNKKSTYTKLLYSSRT